MNQNPNQSSTTETKNEFKIFRCKIHPQERIQRVTMDTFSNSHLACFECLMNKDPKKKRAKDSFLSFKNFVDHAAKLYELVKHFSTLETTVPTELTECLKDKELTIAKLEEYVEQERQKVGQQFDAIAEEFSTLVENKRIEVFKKLDDQVNNLKANYAYYQSKLDQYFGKDTTEYPTREQLSEKINKSGNYEDLENCIRSIKDDMQEISMYGKDPETRAKEIRAALTEFSEIVVQNSKSFPETVCSNDERTKELQKTFADSTKKFFEFMGDIANPIELISLSETGRIDSLIAKKPEEAKLIKSWITNGPVKFKLLYRASVDGFKGENFHKKTDGFAPTLTIIISNHGKAFGGYSDLEWNSVNNYKNSTTTWVFSLDHKEKYVQKSGQAHYAVYCYNTYGPTFGCGHDFYIADNSNSGTACYSNFGYTYECPGKTYGSTQAQSHLAGAYSFSCEEIEVFHVEYKK